jgi:alkylhydroperoxidase family enzyme
MTWLGGIDVAAGPPTVAGALALRPELAELVAAYEAELRCVEPVLLELCRVRIAQLLGDAAAGGRHDDTVAAKVGALATYPTSPLFNEHERTCLNYAEQYVIDVHSLTDDDADAVKRGMSEAEFVAFTVALGMFEGLTRFRLLLGVS